MKNESQNKRKKLGKPKTHKARRGTKSARYKPKAPVERSLLAEERRPDSREDSPAVQPADGAGGSAEGIDLGGRGGSAQTYGSADGWWDTSREGDRGQDRGQAPTENGDRGDGAQSRDTRGHLSEEDQRHTQRVIYQIILPSTEEHPRQHEFIYSEKKRKIIRAGRRGGKTTGVAILAVLEFLKGKAVDYAAPVIEQVGKFWHEVVTALAEPIEFGIYRKLESEKTIFEPGTEHYIHCRTAWNPDTLRGGSTDLLIFDEFQMMHEETWSAAGSPRLIDRNGDAVFIYTPPSLRMRARTQAGDPLHAAKMFKKYRDHPDWLCLHFPTMENPFVSKQGIDEVSADLTQLAYRQEILAEDIEEVPGALWKPTLIDELRVSEIPQEALPLLRIVVGIDPSGSSTNEAGIVAAGKGKNGHGYVLADGSLLAPTPRAWAQEAVRLYQTLSADRIVAERNFGGDMVREVIMTVDTLVSYRDVVASRGKQVRAEPIFALYEKGTIHHVGVFEKLEEEQCSYVPEITRKSPNRMDALVWALTSCFQKACVWRYGKIYESAKANRRRVLESIDKFNHFSHAVWASLGIRSATERRRCAAGLACTTVSPCFMSSPR